MKKNIAVIRNFRSVYRDHFIHIVFSLLFVSFLFLRFYEITERTQLGWDQADSAWAARSILLDNPFRLEGVPIRADMNMFMGPLYYYLIVPFYFFTRLDMIAAPIFASTVSVVCFLIFYTITKRLFNTHIALLGSFIYTFSTYVISYDRVQAAFVLIPTISYVAFYFLYEVITGNEKYIVYLGAIVGFGFHIHFTSIFYLIIVLLTLPFFPRNSKTVRYSAFALLIFMLLLSPILYSAFFAKSTVSNGIIGFISNSYHGFHLKRFFQIFYDGFISFEAIIQFHALRSLAPIIPVLFTVIYYRNGDSIFKKQRAFFIYLLALWIMIPWAVFATYKGELSDYYFSAARPLAIATIAFLLWFVFQRHLLITRILIISILCIYSGYTVYVFTSRVGRGNYLSIRETVRQAIQNGEPIKFKDKDPLSYTYHVYTNDRK